MIKIGLYNITIDTCEVDLNCIIDSDLSDFMPWEYADSMESMILSHYVSGIDVSSNAYQDGILVAVNAIKNNIKQN